MFTVCPNVFRGFSQIWFPYVPGYVAGRFVGIGALDGRGKSRIRWIYQDGFRWPFVANGAIRVRRLSLFPFREGVFGWEINNANGTS